MEGRAIARPNYAVGLRDTLISCLQWRAGQLPGQTWGRNAYSFVQRSFNGGPGNCPAKQSDEPGKLAKARKPSMEGRAIARPNVAVAVAVAVGAPSMEGRAIARPNRDPGPWCRSACTAFNGGRAIARPNHTDRGQVRGHVSPSMEGRAIARPNNQAACGWLAFSALQWRAGQLPGQTRERQRHVCVLRSEPSMEGRAIARPNWRRSSSSVRHQIFLQWRAGQLPGQTGPSRSTARCANAFNGGPGNCPAKPGRAAAGRTGRPRPFNGGPGNCPAKRPRWRRSRAP